MQIFGHGWINSPTPRGYVGNVEGSASTGGPCGRGTVGLYETVTYVRPDDTIEISFRNGGGHPDDGVCTFHISDDEVDGTVFAANQIESMPCVSGESFAVNVTIPDTFYGEVFVQYKWTYDTTSWYGCIKANVSDTLVTVQEVEDTTVTDDASPETKYYRLLSSSETSVSTFDRHTIMKASSSGNGALDVAFGSNLVTQRIDAQISMDGMQPSGSASFCNVFNSDYIFATVWSDELMGSYTVEVDSYKAELGLQSTTAAVTEITDFAPGTYYFHTVTSSTNIRRRITVSGDGSSATLHGHYTSCMPETKLSSSVCHDLPTSQAQKYYALEISDNVNGFNGEVRVAVGSCEEFSGATQMAVMFTLVVLAVLL